MLINLIFAVFIFFAGVLGIFIVKLFLFNINTKHLRILDSFASGIFIAIGIVHFLLSALKLINFNNINNEIIIMIIFVGTFLFFLGYEHLLSFFSHKNNHKSARTTLPLIFISLAFHSFIIGIGSAFINFSNILITFCIALFLHKFFIVVSLATKLKKNNFSFKVIVITILLFSLVTPIGIILGGVLENFVTVIYKSHWILAIILSFSGGILFFIGTCHGLSKSVIIECCCNFKNFIALLFGFFLTSLLAFLI